MIQNLVWAVGYNIIAIALAGGALYAWGVLLSPAIGAALMAARTVIVAINALVDNKMITILITYTIQEMRGTHEQETTIFN